MIKVEQLPYISTYLNDLDGILKEKTRIEEAGDRGIYPKYLEVSNTIDMYFFYHKLRAYCSELSFRLYYKNSKLKHELEDFRFMDMIKKEITTCTKYENNLEIAAYCQLLNLLEKTYDTYKKSNFTQKEVDEAAYMKYLKWLRKHRKDMMKDDVQGILSILTNLTSNSNLAKKHHFMVSNEIINTLEENDKLPKTTYKNIIVLAYKVKDTSIFKTILTNYVEITDNRKEWVKRFGEAYQNRLPEGEESYFYFCKAYVEYEDNDLGAAYKHLSVLDYSYNREMFIKLDVKMLHIKIMLDAILSRESFAIDIQMSEKLTKILNSFRRQIGTEKKNLQENHFLYYNNFYKFAQKIWKLYAQVIPLSPTKLQQKRNLLIENIKHDAPITQRNWLIEKVGQLKVEFL